MVELSAFGDSVLKGVILEGDKYKISKKVLQTYVKKS